MAIANTASLLKFKKLEFQLGIPEPYVLGLLETLWQYAHSTANPVFAPDDVEPVCKWPGAPGILLGAMLDCHWLDRRDDGAVEIHEYWEHAPRYVKDKKRKADERRLNAAIYADPSTKNAKTCGHERSLSALPAEMSAHSADISAHPADLSAQEEKRTKEEENRTEEKRSKSDDSPSPFAANTTPFPASPPPVTLPTPIPQPSLPGLPDTPSRNPKPDELFSQFWTAYPKKLDKGHARKAFLAIKDMPLLLPKILAAIEAQKKSKQWVDSGGKYIPNPATWLNGQRWEDVPEVVNKPEGYADNPCGWE